MPAAELPFQPGCGRATAIKVIQSGASAREKSFQALHKQVKKHLGAALPSPVFSRLRSEAADFVVGWFAWLDGVLRSPAYNFAMTPGVDELRRLAAGFDKFSHDSSCKCGIKLDGPGRRMQWVRLIRHALRHVAE